METLTRSEIIDNILNHTGNFIYDDKLDTFSKQAFFRAELIKFADDTLVQILADMTTNYGLYEIVD